MGMRRRRGCVAHAGRQIHMMAIAGREVAAGWAMPMIGRPLRSSASVSRNSCSARDTARPSSIAGLELRGCAAALAYFLVGRHVWLPFLFIFKPAVRYDAEVSVSVARPQCEKSPQLAYSGDPAASRSSPLPLQAFEVAEDRGPCERASLLLESQRRLWPNVTFDRKFVQARRVHIVDLES